ncbi:hypothetical protein E2C01_046119 [Portunus trituberculatus]|uniref:Uncharacterized protein n=1 Tax=Portunus trituberculatus TaxID=210409 RepID=A0A5B7G3I7_PORTR|nr:hypothetical protein [Portunus trituberculatus]
MPLPPDTAVTRMKRRRSGRTDGRVVRTRNAAPRLPPHQAAASPSPGTRHPPHLTCTAARIWCDTGRPLPPGGGWERDAPASHSRLAPTLSALWLALTLV